MKNQLLLLTFFLLSFAEVQAQNVCCLNVNSKEITQIGKDSLCMSNEQIEAVLKDEIKRFTDYAANEFEYPDLAKGYCLEGEMIVRVVYNKGFERVEITKSINPILDKMVMDQITEYINNFDRTYDRSPRLVFKIPIHFSLEG